MIIPVGRPEIISEILPKTLFYREKDGITFAFRNYKAGRCTPLMIPPLYTLV